MASKEVKANVLYAVETLSEFPDAKTARHIIEQRVYAIVIKRAQRDEAFKHFVRKITKVKE